MVVVDTLTKETHFLPVQSTFGTTQVANVLMKEIVKLHVIPKMIILNKDAKFTAAFWRSLFGGMGTKLNFSTAYHPQTDGQTERKNQVLEDVLRIYVMERTIVTKPQLI